MAYAPSLLLQLGSGEVIVTGFAILILIVASLCVLAGMVSRLSEISRSPRAKPVCLFVAAFFLSSTAYHWQDYSYPFVAGLQLRSFNLTLEAPRTHIQSDIADNFTVAVLSPYLKNIHKMDLVFQRTKDFTNFTFLRFPLPKHCRGSILGLSCDLEREAIFAVKNASDRLQHICASRYSSRITSVDPESGDIIPSFRDFYRYSNRTHQAWTLYTDVDWHVLAVMHCGGKEVTSAIRIEGKANLYGRNLLYYCTDLGMPIVFFFIATITLFGTLRRHDIEVGKIYQQMPREEPRTEETMARVRRLVVYERVRNKLKRIRQKHQKAYDAEYKNHFRMRTSRVTRELAELAADPLTGLEVAKSISKEGYIYFLLKGCKHSAFQGGMYLGMMKLPPDYPLKPPISSFMLSPSGGFFFEEGKEMHYLIRPDQKWNPDDCNLRICFAKLLRYWCNIRLVTKLGWGTDKATIEDLAKWSLESCVELCPGFYDLFPAHSPAKQDKQDDDGISASSIADDWELVNFSTGIRHRKQNPSPIQN